jgi:hypothetical protein
MRHDLSQQERNTKTESGLLEETPIRPLNIWEYHADASLYLPPGTAKKMHDADIPVQVFRPPAARLIIGDVINDLTAMTPQTDR